MFLLLMTFLNFFFQNPSEHEKINDRFSKQLTKKIYQEWQLVGGMNGGKFNPTLEIVSYNFDTLTNSFEMDKASIRKLYIDVIEYLLNTYNNNPTLRNSLSNYPYLHKNIQIIIHLTPNENKLGQD